MRPRTTSPLVSRMESSPPRASEAGAGDRVEVEQADSVTTRTTADIERCAVDMAFPSLFSPAILGCIKPEHAAQEFVRLSTGEVSEGAIFSTRKMQAIAIFGILAGWPK